MLAVLEVEGLAVLRQVRVTFGSGLNVLSGETGAGKSLLLDALQLALGARADAAQVRADAPALRVLALFTLPEGAPTVQRLAELGVTPDQGQILLSREVSRDGRSTCRLNGRVATAGMLRQVGAALVTLVGQGEHHRFATAAGQLALIDAYGGPELSRQRELVAQAYGAWQDALRALRAHGSPAERRARVEELAAQAADIDAVSPRADEEEALQQRLRQLAHAERLLTGLAGVRGLLEEGEENARDRLAAAVRELHGLQRLDPALREAAQLLEQAGIALDEACHLLARYQQGLQLDPQELQAVQARLQQLARLKRLYGGTLPAVLAHRQHIAEELQRLQDAESDLQTRTQELGACRAALAEAALQLAALRRGAAAQLQSEMARELEELGMPGARLVARWERQPDPEGIPVEGELVSCGPEGIERVELLWSAHRGLQPAPLSRAASGGELSRLLLALHALRAGEVDVPTVVFDEIDAGVGGRAATAVARRLQRLGAERQVLCVTHQAVIAAAADHHYAVDPDTQGGLPLVRVRTLEGVSRTVELARMLDGDRGQTSRAHAADMLRRLARPAG